MTTRTSTGARPRNWRTKRGHWRSARQTHGHRPGLARSPSHCARGRAPRRSARDTARRHWRRAHGRRGPRPGGVGGHLGGNGRFSLLFPWSPTAADCDPRRAQVRSGRLTADAGLLLNASERPAEASQRDHLLLLTRVQDVPHGDGGTRGASPRSTSRPTASGNGRVRSGPSVNRRSLPIAMRKHRVIAKRSRRGRDQGSCSDGRRPLALDAARSRGHIDHALGVTSCLNRVFALAGA
jgi:hypothetical protein